MKPGSFMMLILWLSFGNLFSHNLMENMANYFDKQPFGLSTISNLLSDHEAFSQDIPLGGGKSTTKAIILSWNTWARGTTGGFKDNTPGFTLRTEPDADKRISTSFVKIKNFMDKSSNAIVALQEISDQDLKNLATFGADSSSSCVKNKGESFNNCVVYKNTEFKINKNLSTDDIVSLNKLISHKNIEQKDRYLHITLTHLKSGEIVDFVNVHFKWHSKPDEIVAAVSDYFKTCQGTCIITGDFNQNLMKPEITHATKYVFENGSISSQPNKQRKNETTDAIFYKLGSKK